MIKTYGGNILNKKIIVLGLVLLILLVAVGLVLFNSTGQNEDVKVGKIYYTLPNGYHVDGINEIGHVTISNGDEKVYLGYSNDKNIKEHIKNYKQDREKNKETLSIENFTRNNTTIYKSTVVESGVNHYWFLKDGNTYSIYTWDKNSNMDSIFNDLFDSIH